MPSLFSSSPPPPYSLRGRDGGGGRGERQQKRNLKSCSALNFFPPFFLVRRHPPASDTVENLGQLGFLLLNPFFFPPLRERGGKKVGKGWVGGGRGMLFMAHLSSNVRVRGEEEEEGEYYSLQVRRQV